MTDPLGHLGRTHEIEPRHENDRRNPPQNPVGIRTHASHCWPLFGRGGAVRPDLLPVVEAAVVLGPLPRCTRAARSIRSSRAFRATSAVLPWTAIVFAGERPWIPPSWIFWPRKAFDPLPDSPAPGAGGSPAGSRRPGPEPELTGGDGRFRSSATNGFSSSANTGRPL